MTGRHQRAIQLIQTADSLRQEGRVDESIVAAREAIRLMEAARDEGHREDARQLHAAYTALAVTLAQYSNCDESLPWFDKAFAAYEHEHPSGGDHRALSQLSSLRHNYAVALAERDPQQAAVQLEMAVALKEKLVTEHPEQRAYKANLVRTYLSLSHGQSHEVAVRYLNRSFALLRELIEAEPQQMEYVWMLAQSAHDLGDRLSTESAEQAMAMYAASLKALQAAREREDGVPYYLLPVWINAQTKLAEGVMQQGNLQDANSLLSQAITIAENTARQHPSLDPALLDVTRARVQLGRCHALAGNRSEATGIARELAGRENVEDAYHAARIFSLCAGDADAGPACRAEALRLLEHCVAGGYFDTPSRLDTLHQEPDFSSLHDAAAFDKLLSAARSRLRGT